MKKLLITLSFITSFAFGQEAIFNINRSNLHLINFAFTDYGNRAKLDNSFEKYSSERFANTTNLYVAIPIRDRTFASAINIKYDNLNKNNNTLEADAIFVYRFNLKRDLSINTSANIGYIQNNISYLNLQERYSYKSLSELSKEIEMQDYNLGFSTIIYGRYHQIGFSVNHLNKPKIPTDNNDRIPIKYNAFTSILLLRGKKYMNLVLGLIYQYQDKFYYNNFDLDYYYNTLSYLGISLNFYSLKAVDFGLGLKMLSNNNDIISAQIGYNIRRLGLSYSFSFMHDRTYNKDVQFHQLGIYYTINTSGFGGKVRHITCPNF